MKTRYAVPFTQFRAGAVIEFEVQSGKPKQGTIQHLTAYGARNLLAVLSRCVDHDGVVRESTDVAKGAPPLIINLCHATRVIAHSTGDVVFDGRQDTRLLEEVSELRGSKGYTRRGNNVILTWDTTSPSLALQILVQDYLLRNLDELGVQPWEIVDLEKMLKSLYKARIARQSSGGKDEFLSSTVTVRFDKLKRFMRQNINRFKMNLNAEQRAEKAFDEEMYLKERAYDDFPFGDDDSKLPLEEDLECR